MENSKLKALADQCGLTLDSNDETRLFKDDEKIHVYAQIMNQSDYDQMEKKIKETQIQGDGYSVYAWNDVSGFNYWHNDNSANYIQITASIKDIEEINPEKLKSDIDKLYNEFCLFDNSEAGIDFLIKNKRI